MACLHNDAFVEWRSCGMALSCVGVRVCWRSCVLACLCSRALVVAFVSCLDNVEILDS